MLFRSIRPSLECNSNIWNPTKKYLIDKLENIQRRFTKRVPSLSCLSYSERLSALNLEPLELRRLKFDLIQYYKILHNLTCIEPTSYFQFHYPPSSSRNPAPFLQKSSNFNHCLESSFFFRQLDCWNALPLSVKQSTSLPAFKNHIKTHDFSKFLKAVLQLLTVFLCEIFYLCLPYGCHICTRCRRRPLASSFPGLFAYKLLLFVICQCASWKQ